MPLPDNVSISLHNQPADPVSKPKHAVLVRLSPEALEALGDPNHPRMDFQFGDEPGIYIGDQFFPIKRQTDDVRHELFLRAATAARPNPPLKHYATITGKLEVTRRLGPNLTDKLRKSTIEAAEQHSNRRTILIDNPPDLSNVPTRKKKEHASMFRKPARLPDNPVPRTAPVPSTSTSSTTAAPTKDGVVPLRTRLVRYVALNEPTSEEVVRVVGRDGTRRSEILECLNQLAEQIPLPGKKTTDKMDTSEYKWRLRPSSWLQVRPYEWPNLKEAERTSMARSARSACNTLKIPESDPVWQHFRFRNPSSATPASVNDSSKGSIVPESSSTAKRGVSSKEVKKKPKAPKAEIQIKDETRPPPPRPSMTAAPSSVSSSSLRKPGSGYKLSRTPSQDMTPDTVTKTKATSDPRLKDAPRYAPVTEERRTEKASDAERIKAEATDSDREAVKRRERVLEKERFRPVDADSDREAKRHAGKERSSKGMEVSTKGKERDSSGVLKRKKAPPPEDDDAPSASSSSVQLKKRRMDQEPTHPSRHSLPQKPTLDLAPHTKTIKKEPSPLPPRPSHQKTPSTSSKTGGSGKGNGAMKVRRRSPVYTSSDEDDGQRQVAPLPTPPTTTPSSLSSQPASHSVLRAKYRKKYVEQLDSYRDVCELKRRIEEMLENNNSSGTITESEGDIDTWDVNAVAKRYAGVREEMQTIRQVFEGEVRSRV